MSYKSLLVHLELGVPNEGILKIAGDLAQRFHAGVIGIAGRQFNQAIYGEGYISGDIIEQDREEIDKEIAAAETEFRQALHARAGTLDWRSTVTFGPVASYLAHQARSADLIITKVDREGPALDPSRHIDIGDIVMRAGRPVLVVPPMADTLKLDRVIVAWKDTRETRRAITDALPFLEKAIHVAVVQIATEDEQDDARLHVKDVVFWLGSHGIAAEAIVSPSSGDDAGRLGALVQEHAADLLVAGAYGHSRLREWVLGGVTRDLLLRSSRPALVSH